MRIAFYAPLKPVDHPTPSGDRRMARAFLSLLQSLGHEVTVASNLRSLDRHGDISNQQRIREASRLEVETLLAGKAPKPDLWFTYHAYHKAPDWIGPQVASRLGIPYITAEASIAGKQANGPWAMGHAASLEGLSKARHILAMTRVDLAGLTQHLPEVQTSLFPPFLDCTLFNAEANRVGLAARYGLNPGVRWIVAVAMMRNDVKRRSFERLARTFGLLGDVDAELLVVGDGEARADIEYEFSERAAKVRFLGRLDAGSIASLLASADLMLWPALREAYGMALLEAQAAALPVVAGNEGGVGDIIENGRTGFLVNGHDPDALADAARLLLNDHDLRQQFGHAARQRTRNLHDLPVAAQRLATILADASRCG